MPPSGEVPEPSKRSRASGELLDYLLMEFEANPNPSNEAKKAISDKTGLPEKSVRIWFQNRRAKARKLEKRSSVDSSSGKRTRDDSGNLGPALFHGVELPVHVNESYCFIECSTLSVGDWQRVQSGYISAPALELLTNLSPIVLTEVLDRCDLLILLSKKNHEVNYFFLSVFENKKILFRIFYPIASVINSSLLEHSRKEHGTEEGGTASPNTTELRLSLNAPPKFCVYFSNNDTNKWCICEDFSENQQVRNAYIGGNGTGDPHALVGNKGALQFLSAFIIDHNNNLGVNNLQVKLQGRSGHAGDHTGNQNMGGVEVGVMDFAQFQIENSDSPAMQYTNEYPPSKAAVHMHLPMRPNDPLMAERFQDGDDFVSEGGMAGAFSETYHSEAAKAYTNGGSETYLEKTPQPYPHAPPYLEEASRSYSHATADAYLETPATDFLGGDSQPFDSFGFGEPHLYTLLNENPIAIPVSAPAPLEANPAFGFDTFLKKDFNSKDTLLGDDEIMGDFVETHLNEEVGEWF